MKKTSLAISISYYALLAYVCANVVLTHLHIQPFEAVVFNTKLFGPFLVRNLVSLLGAIALAALLTHREGFRNSLVPIFSLVLSGIVGISMMVAYTNQTPLSKWSLIWILFLASLVLEWLHHTLSGLDALEDFAFSYTLVGLFIELMGWVGIPLVSWDAFLASAFFGLIQVWLATHCHTLPASPKPPHKVKPVKKPKEADAPET